MLGTHKFFLLLLPRRNEDSNSNNNNNKSNNNTNNSNPPNAIGGESHCVGNSALREHRYSGGERRTVAHAAADSSCMRLAGGRMAHVASHGADISWATALEEPEFDIDGLPNWTDVEASLRFIPDVADPHHPMGYHTGGEDLNNGGGLEWALSSSSAFTPCSTVGWEPQQHCPMEGAEEGLATLLSPPKRLKRGRDGLEIDTLAKLNIWDFAAEENALLGPFSPGLLPDFNAAAAEEGTLFISSVFPMAAENDAVFGPSAFLTPPKIPPMGGSDAMGDGAHLGLAALHNPPRTQPWGSSDEAMGDDALLGLVEQSPESKRRRSSSASMQGHVCWWGMDTPFSTASVSEWERSSKAAQDVWLACFRGTQERRHV